MPPQTTNIMHQELPYEQKLLEKSHEMLVANAAC
jgi:hypothetical protein